MTGVGRIPPECSYCHRPLSLGEALRVVNLPTGAERFVHRPSVRLDGIPAGRCLHFGVAGTLVDRVSLADPDAAREHYRAQEPEGKT